MTFGNGDGTIFIDFASSLEVVAHEMSHGVTQFTANLRYYSQSGAPNEHFSDVFGTAITQYAAGETADTADWLIGNEIMGPELSGEALRSMSVPGTAYDNRYMGKDPQPDNMSNYYWGLRDSQGVHINSGIPNKVFYLVAMELGTDNAVKTWYDALRKLRRSADFNDAVEVIADSAQKLTKNKEVGVGAARTVRAAFKEVGPPYKGMNISTALHLLLKFHTALAHVHAVSAHTHQHV